VLIIKCSKYSCRQNLTLEDNSPNDEHEEDSEDEGFKIHVPFKERFKKSIEKNLRTFVSAEIMTSELAIKKTTPKSLFENVKANLGLKKTKKNVSSTTTGTHL